MSYTFYKMEVQNSRGLSGAGLIGNIFKVAKPFVKKIASSAFKSGKKRLLKEGRNAAYRMITDKILGRDMKTSLKNNALQVLGKTAISGLDSGINGLKRGANFKMGKAPKRRGNKKKVIKKKTRKVSLKGRGKLKNKTPGLSQSQFNTLVKKWKKNKRRR